MNWLLHHAREYIYRYIQLWWLTEQLGTDQSRDHLRAFVIPWDALYFALSTRKGLTRLIIACRTAPGIYLITEPVPGLFPPFPHPPRLIERGLITTELACVGTRPNSRSLYESRNLLIRTKVIKRYSPLIWTNFLFFNSRLIDIKLTLNELRKKIIGKARISIGC